MSEDLDSLLNRVTRASSRLRIAMAVTGGLCVLIAIGIASDDGLWRSGLQWRVAGVAGVLAFLGVAALAGYAVVRGQRRHVGTLRTLLRDHPARIRSIRLQVARAVPYASWAADDGTAGSGLHIVISDDAGSTWVLPLSREEAPTMTAELVRRCPRAVVEPGDANDT